MTFQTSRVRPTNRYMHEPAGVKRSRSHWSCCTVREEGEELKEITRGEELRK